VREYKTFLDQVNTIKTILKINLYLTKWAQAQEMNRPINLIALGFQDQEHMIKVN